MKRAKSTDARLQSADRDTWQQQKTIRYIPLTPANHVSMSTQTDTSMELLPELPTEKGTMTAYGSAMVDAQTRLAAVQMSMQPYNNYYQRMRMRVEPGVEYGPVQPVPPPSRGPSQQYKDKSPPTFRTGNKGSSWRHVQQCTGALGNHICLIDGAVKTSDIKYFPPYGFVKPEPQYNPQQQQYDAPQYNPQQQQYDAPHYNTRASRLQSAPMRRHQDHAQRISVEDSTSPNPQFRNPRTGSPSRSHGGSGVMFPKRSTSYNQNARKGFRYWYDERPPGMPSRPARTIMGNMMKMGVGY